MTGRAPPEQSFGLSFSCQTRNFCPSCQAKRSALVAEKVAAIAAPVPHRHISMTIPKALRGILERDRKLLTLLSRTAYDAVRRTFAGLLGRDDVVPGVAASIQTFGSFGANFHPHWHALVTEGAFAPDGTFLPLAGIDMDLIEAAFRRLLIRRLHGAERLSAEFRDNLLSWVHSGFSVHAERTVAGGDAAEVERIARYLTRAPVRLDAVRAGADGRVRVTTPPESGTGATERELDALDWVHALVQQIPDPGQHMTRYYGAYANRARKRLGAARAAQSGGSGIGVGDGVGVGDAGVAGSGAPACAQGETGGEGAGAAGSKGTDRDESTYAKKRRANWARLLRKILEVDALTCPKCGVEMRIVAVLTEPAVVDRILEHLGQTGSKDPFEGVDPPPGGMAGAGTAEAVAGK